MKKRTMILTLAGVVLAALAPFSWGAIDTQHFTAEQLLAAKSKPGEPVKKTPGSSSPSLKMPDGTAAVAGVFLPVEIKNAGTYRISFPYAQMGTVHDNLTFKIIRQDTEETVYFDMIDYSSIYPGVPSEPLPEFKPANVQKKIADFDINFEAPGKYILIVTGCYGFREPQQGFWGKTAPAPLVSELWLSNDPMFTIEKPTPVTDAPVTMPTADGFELARVHVASAKLNSALPARERLQLCLHESYCYYHDFTESVNIGVNMNLQGDAPDKNFELRDTPVTGGCEFGLSKEQSKEFNEKYPGKTGKYADSRGNVGGWSFSFEPYRRACYETAVKSVRYQVAQPWSKRILNWYSAWEQCGSYDYGECSVNAFRHEYLPEKYGSLDNLNKAWHTDYTSFDEIVPVSYYACVGKGKLKDELELARAKANFIDFRDFNSKAYASWLGLKSKAIMENDPDHRNMTSAYSNNNLGSICWLKWRPLCFEDAMQLTLKGSGTMGWDIYGTDDLVATAFEHWYSFGDEQTIPMIKEANIHSLGNELTARTFYNVFGEGMRGMAFFDAQEGPKPELRKFGMRNPDDNMAPRPKMAALSDVFRALQQVEPFMAYARRRSIGKPVAIYYSQTCNVMQERGYGSMFDCAPDSHMHVFELIRGCGYPCTIITERQILEGKKLDDISAIFFVDAQYLDDKVVDKLQGWIEQGGHIVADGQTGCYDSHGFPSTKMINLLGIEPIKPKRVDESVAEKLAFGYSSQAFEAVNPDELWLTMREYLHQRDTQHPVAKAAGKIMISGFGAQNVRSKAGEVIILGNNGEVGWNIRQIGKGSASYFAGYLGTIYGSGCTQYEWRDAHSDDSPSRWFDALLRYFGAKKNAETDLEEHTHVRYGSPLVDPNGNMLSVFTNFSDHRLQPFSARTYLPEGVKPPKMVLFSCEGSRKVQQLDVTYNKELNAIEYTMPSFRVFANVMQIQDQKYPMLSVECMAGPEHRDAYRLPDFRPGQEMVFKAKVFNTTGKTLPKGKITLRLYEGWFYDKETVEVPAIPAYGSSDEFTFKVKAPSVCMARRLRPVNFVYASGEITSTPSVEMVWFQKEAQEPKKKML